MTHALFPAFSHASSIHCAINASVETLETVFIQVNIQAGSCLRRTLCFKSQILYETLKYQLMCPTGAARFVSTRRDARRRGVSV